jgi:hypothetical protein
MTRHVHWIAALLLVATGCDKGGEFAVSSGTITGRVTLAADGTPVAGATVEVGVPSLNSGNDVSAVTNQNGDYSMRATWFTAYENPPGMIEFVMRVSKADFETVRHRGLVFTPDGVYYPVTMAPTSTCTWPAEISVSSGTAPMFSWTPPCNMWRVIVADSTGLEHWRLSSTSGNVISPPVTFGAYAPEAGSFMSAPLTPGRPYTFSIYRWTGPAPGDSELAGQRTFRP